MLLWPFNKYPGTDYETFNWEWILKTVKTYTKKVDDFIADMTDAWQDFSADMTDTWNDFREWTTGEIDQMHNDFAQYVNVTEGALNTGAIANGAITKPKIDPDFLMEIENDWVTPEMYGAVGNGVVDDTTAVQNAFNSGKHVLANNTYRLTSTVTINNDRQYIGGTFVADHAGTMLKIMSDGSTLTGMTLDGDDKAGVGIECDNCKYVTITNCTVFDIYNKNGGAANESTAIRINGCSYITVEKCYIHDVKNTSQYTNVSRAISSRNSENIDINWNNIQNITATPSGTYDANAIEVIYENRPYGDNNIKITHNTFGYTTKRIIKIQQSGVTIDGNIFEYDADNETIDQALAVFHSNVIIQNNDFKTHTPSMMRVGDVNDDVSSIRDIKIIGNNFETHGTRYQGIINITDPTTNVQIDNNIFKSLSTTETGISFRGDCDATNTLIRGNTFEGFAQCIGSMSGADITDLNITSNIGEAIYTFVNLNDNCVASKAVVVGNSYTNNTTPPSAYLKNLVVYRQSAVNDFIVESNIKPSGYGDHSTVT